MFLVPYFFCYFSMAGPLTEELQQPLTKLAGPTKAPELQFMYEKNLNVSNELMSQLLEVG